MKLLDVLKTVGGEVLRSAVPGGGAILQLVNAALPSGAKLPDNATGSDALVNLSTLPEADRAALLGREFDVTLTQIKENNATLRAMLESDKQNPQSTRPLIARGAFHVTSFVIIVVVSMWAYGLTTKNTELVTAVVNGWPFVLSVVAPLVTLLLAYFGVIKNEHNSRLNAANGQSTSGISAIVGQLLKR